MPNTLVLGTAASVLVAGLYFYIANVVHGRKVSAEARLARDLFALWWGLLGLTSLLGATQVFLYVTGNLPVWLYLTVAQLTLFTLFVALWALQVYLVYLYRGSKRPVLPLAAFYLLLYTAIVGLLHWIGPPDAIADNGWRLRTEPQADLGRGFGITFLLLLVGPQIIAAIAYARLYRRTSDRTQRYRIALLTGSIIVWFGTSAVVGAASDPDEVNVPWQIASRLLALAAALAILFAYKPPRWVRERYGIQAIETEERKRPTPVT